jgi:hypothetical protein
MKNWDYCTVYQVSQMEGWITGFGMVRQGDFTEDGAVRQELVHSPDALAQVIARLGKDGWEMVGCGNVGDAQHAIYFKRPIEE